MQASSHQDRKPEDMARVSVSSRHMEHHPAEQLLSEPAGSRWKPTSKVLASPFLHLFYETLFPKHCTLHNVKTSPSTRMRVHSQCGPTDSDSMNSSRSLREDRSPVLVTTVVAAEAGWSGGSPQVGTQHQES